MGRTQAKHDVSRELAEQMADQCLGFLILVARHQEYEPNRVIGFGPAPKIDDAWHELLVYTSEYRALCKVLTNGGTIDHRPYDLPDVDYSSAPTAADTATAMRAAGIAVIDGFWYGIVDCCGCDTGGGTR